MAWDEAPLVCSPFIALSWPAVLLGKLYSLVACAPGSGSLSSSLRKRRSKLTLRPRRPKGPQGKYDPNSVDDTAKHAGEGPIRAALPFTSTSASIATTSTSAAALSARAPIHGKESSPPKARSTQGAPSSTPASGTRLKKQGTTRSMLTSVGARQSQEETVGISDKPDLRLQSQNDIVAFLTNWILDHEDEVNQSERWRTQMQKKNAKRFDKVDKGIASLAASLREVKRSQVSGALIHDRLTELKGMLDAVKQEAGDSGSGRGRKSPSPTHASPPR